MRKITKALIAAGAVLAFGSALAVDVAEAQAITAGPIQTAPETGYPGCGGNSMIRDISTSADANGEWKCANKRTYTFGAQSRTITVVVTFRTNNTASASYTVNAPWVQDIPLVVRSHVGISSTGPVLVQVEGTIPRGSTGPVVLNWTYTCGQQDIKAVFTAPGNSDGRIAGPYVCMTQVVPTTTVPTTATPPTSAPSGSVAPTSTPAAPGPSVSSGVVGALPATGISVAAVFGLAVIALFIGAVAFFGSRRPVDPRDL